MSEVELRVAARYNQAMADLEATKAKRARGKQRADALARQQLWLQMADEIDTYLQQTSHQRTLL